MKVYIQLFCLGALTSLLFPPFFLLPLGFIIFPIFFYIITNFKNKSLIKSFTEGYIYALGMNLCLFFWLKNPFLIEESTKKYFLLPYVIVFYLSIYFGLFSLTLRFFINKKFFLLLIKKLETLCIVMTDQMFNCQYKYFLRWCLNHRLPPLEVLKMLDKSLFQKNLNFLIKLARLNGLEPRTTWFDASDSFRSFP